MRTLIVVPIVHTPEDLGTHIDEVKRQYIQRHGLRHWQQRLGRVEELWQDIRRRVLALPLDLSKVKLYQDGLPECGRELEIVEELAQEGSKNYLLLLELVRKGGTLMGTESPALLMRERELFTHRIAAGKKPGPSRQGLYDRLIERRDEYIAQRINATLQDGETGLLFIGALHKVQLKLPPDVEIRGL